MIPDKEIESWESTMLMILYLFIMTLYYKMRQTVLQNVTTIFLQNASGVLVQDASVQQFFVFLMVSRDIEMEHWCEMG